MFACLRIHIMKCNYCFNINRVNVMANGYGYCSVLAWSPTLSSTLRALERARKHQRITSNI